MTMSQTERNKRDENAAGCRELQAMERRHNNVACARDVALSRCEERVGARRSAETLAEERREQTENEQRLSCLRSIRVRGGARA